MNQNDSRSYSNFKGPNSQGYVHAGPASDTLLGRNEHYGYEAYWGLPNSQKQGPNPSQKKTQWSLRRQHQLLVTRGVAEIDPNTGKLYYTDGKRDPVMMWTRDSLRVQVTARDTSKTKKQREENPWKNEFHYWLQGSTLCRKDYGPFALFYDVNRRLVPMDLFMAKDDYVGGLLDGKDNVHICKRYFEWTVVHSRSGLSKVLPPKVAFAVLIKLVPTEEDFEEVASKPAWFPQDEPALRQTVDPQWLNPYFGSHSLPEDVQRSKELRAKRLSNRKNRRNNVNKDDNKKKKKSNNNSSRKKKEEKNINKTWVRKNSKITNDNDDNKEVIEDNDDGYDSNNSYNPRPEQPTSAEVRQNKID